MFCVGGRGSVPVQEETSRRRSTRMRRRRRVVADTTNTQTSLGSLSLETSTPSLHLCSSGHATRLHCASHAPEGCRTREGKGWMGRSHSRRAPSRLADRESHPAPQTHTLPPTAYLRSARCRRRRARTARTRSGSRPRRESGRAACSGRTTPRASAPRARAPPPRPLHGGRARFPRGRGRSAPGSPECPAPWPTRRLSVRPSSRGPRPRGT